MQRLYKENQEGLPFSYPAKKISFKYAFELLVNGAEYSDLLEAGCTELQISKAKESYNVAPHADKMLISTLRKKFEISKGAVSDMLRIYREQEQAEMIREDVNENEIPVYA